MQKVLVLGGAGFCGWATSLHLSQKGYDVTIIDNMSRRKISDEINADSLTPISDIATRIDAWNKVSGKAIKFLNIDVAMDYTGLKIAVDAIRPDTIVHFAEQRAAPYSMKSTSHKQYTVSNNLVGTHNVLCVINEVDPRIHLVHLGTMGVYGYSSVGLQIPEGYMQIQAEGKDLEIMYPPKPGSIYHMTKTQDALFFQFYAQNDNLRITDLHQGIVWGTNKKETKLDEALINRMDYDSDYGTVLNRFTIQAAIGHPLTVYGTGGQTRAFIHIQNSVECIALAIENPPNSGDRVTIRNQTTECHRLSDLVEIIKEHTDCKVMYIDNPRKEAVENDLDVCKKSFLDLGLEPITLKAGLLDDTLALAKKYHTRVNRETILPMSKW
jgi:UDP-sulfoquinovose synthase